MSEDIEALLLPIDEDTPAGPNLEYDADFQALEERARPRPERALGAGVIASEPPQWRLVVEQATALMLRTKDLRIAAHLCTARLHTDGFLGWSTGLALIHALLEQYWDLVHPRLDADNDDDPVERINALASLADPSTLTALRATQLFEDLHAAHFSLRDLRLAQGLQREADSEDDERPGLAAIDACLREIPLDALASTEAILVSAEHTLEAITTLFAERTPGRGPTLDMLSRDLHELSAFLRTYLIERTASAVPSADTATADAGAAAQPIATGLTTSIERREDVLRVLEQVCDYYARREPSSPVPLLLRRAQRLVGMDFAELLRDLAPGGISELQVVSGQQHDS